MFFFKLRLDTAQLCFGCKKKVRIRSNIRSTRKRKFAIQPKRKFIEEGSGLLLEMLRGYIKFLLPTNEILISLHT